MGQVGEVDSIDTDILAMLSGSDYIPVIAPVAGSDTGQTYNINADTMSGAISASILSERLILLTDVKGVLDKKGNF